MFDNNWCGFIKLAKFSKIKLLHTKMYNKMMPSFVHLFLCIRFQQDISLLNKARNIAVLSLMMEDVRNLCTFIDSQNAAYMCFAVWRQSPRISARQPAARCTLISVLYRAMKQNNKTKYTRHPHRNAGTTNMKKH